MAGGTVRDIAEERSDFERKLRGYAELLKEGIEFQMPDDEFFDVGMKYLTELRDDELKKDFKRLLEMRQRSAARSENASPVAPASGRAREARTHQVILNTNHRRTADVAMIMGDNLSVEVCDGGCWLGNDRAEHWIVLRSETGNDVVVGDLNRLTVRGRLIRHEREGGYDPYRFTFEPPKPGQYIIIAELGCRGGGGRHVVIDVKAKAAEQ